MRTTDGPRRRAPALAAVCLALAAACAPGADETAEPSADPTTSPETSEAAEEPTGPPVEAVLRQDSRDAARGQVQVWLTNRTGAPLLPTSITYRDGRLTRAVAAERLREVPEGRELGFPVPLPGPACPAEPARTGRVEVVWAGGRRTVPVTDENGTVATYATAGCDARRVERVARVSFRDAVPVTGEGRQARARLLLAVEPTGRAPEASLTVVTVGGTPVLAPAGGLPVWSPRQRVGGADGPQVVELPVVPARCDSHAFLEAGGATAFRVAVRLAEPGRAPLRTELVVRMGPAGARAVLDHALEACGLTG